jgi:imidazolonepropionase-like amidohydrolase
MAAKSIHAQVIYTGKSVVRDAFLVFSGKKIVGVAKKRRGELAADCAVLTPAFCDPHCHIGMWRHGDPSAECEANAKLDTVVTLCEALDSVQMDDESFARSVRAGVLYSWVLPGSGNVFGGRGAVIRNYAPGTNEALIHRRGVKGAFGYNVIAKREWGGQRPNTRMGALSVMRSTLSAVRKKLAKRKRLRGKRRAEVEFSAEESALVDLLEGRETFMAHAHKPDDIAALLRLVDEFGLKLSVQHTMGVNRVRVYQELARRKATAVYGPVDFLAFKVELKNMDPRDVKLLVESGVEYGLMSDHPIMLQENLILALRHFLRAGLSEQECIELVTRRNARLMGLEGVLGTLERGKWASFTCWSGDPFRLGSFPAAVYGEGRMLCSEENS